MCSTLFSTPVRHCRRLASHLVRLALASAIAAGSTAGAIPYGPRVTLFSQATAPYLPGGLPIGDPLPVGDSGPFDSLAADDVVVPSGQVWAVDGVRLGLIGAPLPGPPTASITIYRPSQSTPGEPVCAYSDLEVGPSLPDGTGGTSVAIDLPSPCVLCAGTTYWVAAQLSATPGTTISWRFVSWAPDGTAGAIWRNPAGGLGTSCSDWTAAALCLSTPSPTPQLAFALEGRRTYRTAERGDFDGDLCPDLVFQHESTGEGRIWRMNGDVRFAEMPISPAIPDGWRIVGSDDLTGDGLSDLLLQNALGEVQVWPMKNAQREGEPLAIQAAPQPAPNRRLVAVAAASGGGNAVCQDPKGGGVVIWRLSNIASTCGTPPCVHYDGGTVPDPATSPTPELEVVGLGDFDHDGNPDLLFQDRVTRRIEVWILDASLHRIATLPATPEVPADGNWAIRGLGDFGIGPTGSAEGPDFAYGDLDLLWQNSTSSRTVIWHMNGLTKTSGQFTSPDGPKGSGGPTPSPWVLVAPR